jgi:hypothetical protein
VSEHVAQRILTLPNSAGLKPRDLEHVASVFLTALDRARAAGRVRKIFEACTI